MLGGVTERGSAHTNLDVAADVRAGRGALQRGHGDGRKPER